MEEVRNELVKIEDCAYPALVKSADVSIEDELLSEELESLGNIQLKFPKIKLGASGNGKLEVPDADNPNESSSAKELECVIVMATTSRAKWSEGETIPDCASSNGKTSFNGQNCATCKFCKFLRSKDGTLVRPECKESRNLYVLTKEHSMPLQFQIPPSGIKTYNDFARDLLSSRQTQLGAIIKINVETKENSAKQKYNIAKFNLVGRVDAETTKRLIELRKTIAATIEATSLQDAYSEDGLQPIELGDEEKDGLPF